MDCNAAITTSACAARSLAQLFRFYDRDNSGTISFDEFRGALRRDAKLTAAMVSDAELEQLFVRVDADSSGEVSLGELVTLMETAASYDTEDTRPRLGGEKKDEAQRDGVQQFEWQVPPAETQAKRSRARAADATPNSSRKGAPGSTQQSRDAQSRSKGARPKSQEKKTSQDAQSRPGTKGPRAKPRPTSQRRPKPRTVVAHGSLTRLVRTPVRTPHSSLDIVGRGVPSLPCKECPLR